MATRTVVRKVEGFCNTALRIPYAYGVLDCGHGHTSIEIGATVVCDRCKWQADALAVLRDAIETGQPQLSHSRARTWCGVDQIYVYKRDLDSPTGCLLFVTVEDTPEAYALLRGPLSPLSPTEGR